MSLDWRLNVADPGAVGIDGYDNTDKNQWVITESLIWATMMVSLEGITEKNWTEYYARIAIWEKLHGTFVQKSDGTPVPITPEDIHKRIGLKCNVSDQTRAAWIRRVVGNQMKDLAYKAGQAIEQKEKAESVAAAVEANA